MIALRDGHWYRSRAALARLAAMGAIDAPHATPDGFAVLVFDRGGRSVQPVAGGAPVVTLRPAALVVQAEHGHDLQRLVRDGATARLERAEFPPDALEDVEPLVEYDHLPESRKDYSVYPRGHRLA